MQPGILVLDGLWYCLRPAYKPAPLSRAGFFSISKNRVSKPCVTTTLSSASPQSYYNSTSGARSICTEYEASQNVRDRTARDYQHVEGPYQELPAVQSRQNGKSGQYDGNSPKVKVKWPRSKKPLGVPRDVELRTTESLETKLQTTMAKSPNIMSATQILRCLIRDRHVRPEVRHYRALILANTDAERGSPEVVRGLLSEMEKNRIPTDSGTLHAALQVLAVHPDYLLRQQIIDTLRDRWLTLSPAGWHFAVAGLVRQHQFELALDYVSVMETKGIHIESWLHSLLVYNLCDFEEYDEVLNLMRSRVSQHYDITYDLWMYVLDMASKAFHHETTSYVWKQRVQLNYLCPSYEVCSNVLRVASRAGDTELAASVFRFLRETGTPLKLEDYEKMVDAHIMHGDLYNAFDILCNMYRTGIALQESSTRPIFTYMTRNNTSPLDAWTILKRLKTTKHEIPTSLAKVIFQRCEHLALYDQLVVDDGIAIYKDLYILCPEGADALIYNALINMCRRGRNHKAAMFIVKEMATLGVTPDAMTYEHLILACLDATNYQSAYLYFEDMLNRGYAVSEEGRTEIRKLLTSGSIDDHFAAKLRAYQQIMV